MHIDNHSNAEPRRRRKRADPAQHGRLESERCLQASLPRQNAYHLGLQGACQMVQQDGPVLRAFRPAFPYNQTGDLLFL